MNEEIAIIRALSRTAISKVVTVQVASTHVPFFEPPVLTCDFSPIFIFVFTFIFLFETLTKFSF